VHDIYEANQLHDWVSGEPEILGKECTKYKLKSGCSHATDRTE
jgi:hypothetical protein